MDFSLLDVVYHVLNIVVLYIILRAILYKPVRKYMQQREEKEAGRREEAEKYLADAQALKEQNEKLLLDTQAHVQDIADENLAYAKQTAERLKEDAQVECGKMLDDARAIIRAEKQEANEQLVEQTAALAVDLASRILGREISKEDNEELIEQYFSKVG